MARKKTTAALTVDHSVEPTAERIESEITTRPTGRSFIQPDPQRLQFGNECLEGYLKRAGLNRPLIVRTVLAELDWSGFEQRYARIGRPPYAPSAMLGLILYGVMQGISSLRGLERLSRSDLGAMWVSGGIYPDHANIGRFIELHGPSLSGEFFEHLTRAVLRRTGGGGKSMAGDGTVIEAACSNYQLLKAESIQAHVQRTRAAAASAPDDRQKQRQTERAEQAQQQLAARMEAARINGKPPDRVCVSGNDPEAVVQQLKRHRGSSPAYKPLILANEQRVIMGTYLDGSSETCGLAQALGQSERISAEANQELLLDAGFCIAPVIELTLDQEISLLCPEGRQPGQGKRSSGVYAKSTFSYDAQSDCYICPAGQSLQPLAHCRGSQRQRAYVQYGSSACENCAQKSLCTRSAKGRKIKRYEVDEAKEALRWVMSQPQAKSRYRQRQAWVEPVFSALRGAQGLNRFRRFGKANVRCEWMIHVLAYNLSRAVAAAIEVGLRFRLRGQAWFGKITRFCLKSVFCP